MLPSKKEFIPVLKVILHSGLLEKGEVSYLVQQDFRAVVADAAQDFDDGSDEAWMEHGLGQLDVPKKSRGVLD